MREIFRRFIPLWVSLIAYPILLIVASLQASLSPPNMLWAQAFFPFPFLIGVVWEYFRPGEYTAVGFVSMLTFTILQISTYGLALSLSQNKWRTAAIVFGIHVFVLALAVVLDLIIL